MIIPYITKYYCKNHKAYRRVTFKMWYRHLKYIFQYITAHANSGASDKQIMDRISDKFGVDNKELNKNYNKFKKIL